MLKGLLGLVLSFGVGVFFGHLETDGTHRPLRERTPQVTIATTGMVIGLALNLDKPSVWKLLLCLVLTWLGRFLVHEYWNLWLTDTLVERPSFLAYAVAKRLDRQDLIKRWNEEDAAVNEILGMRTPATTH